MLDNKVVLQGNRENPRFRLAYGKILAFLLAWVCIGPLVNIMAGDYWVIPRGKDATGRGSLTRPWATIQYAADRVKPGDIVHVGDGDYEGFDLRHGGTREATITFKAEGKQVRIVKRNAKSPDGINIEVADFVVLDGFIINAMPRAGVRAIGSHLTIRGIRTSQNGSWGIFTAHCNDLAIIGNHVSESVKEHGIYVSNSGDRPIIRGNISWGNRQCGIHMNGDRSQGGDGIISDAVVENNFIFDNGRGGGSGINCDGVQDSIFRNNVLFDNHASGISLYRIDGGEGPKNIRVFNNTISMARDARWALNIGQGLTGNKAWNNILINNNPSRGSIHIEADSIPGFESDYNIVVDRFSHAGVSTFLGLSGWQSMTGLDRHSFVTTSKDIFINPNSGDYHLVPGCRAIDAADPALSSRKDIEGRLRPVGPRPDIGAYESPTSLKKNKGTSPVSE